MLDFDLELEESEVDFAIFSVFEVMHRIRAETQQIWHRLRAGEISIIYATLLITAALQLVRNAEEEAI